MKKTLTLSAIALLLTSAAQVAQADSGWTKADEPEEVIQANFWDRLQNTLLSVGYHDDSDDDDDRDDDDDDDYDDDDDDDDDDDHRDGDPGDDGGDDDGDDD